MPGKRIMDHHHWGRSHPIEREQIRDLCLDTYSLLLADVSSSEKVANFIANHLDERIRVPALKKEHPIHFYLQYRFGQRLSNLLISISVRYRIYDDLVNNSSHKTEHESLHKSIEENDGLSLREVCNKIIHASGIDTDWWTIHPSDALGNDKTPMRYRSKTQAFCGIVTLKGMNRKVEWKHEIDVLKFINDVFTVCKFNT